MKSIGRLAVSVFRSFLSQVSGDGGGPKGPQIPGCWAMLALTPLGRVLDAMIEQVAPMECPAITMLSISTMPKRGLVGSSLAALAISIALSRNLPSVLVVKGFLSFSGLLTKGKRTTYP